MIGGIPPLIFQVYRFPTFERIVDYRINQEVDPENTNIPVCFKTSLEEGEVYDEYPLTNGVAFSRDGKRVFCPDFSGDIIEFAIPSGIEVAKRPGHSDVATSIDGDEKCDRFVSAGRDGSLIYWEGDAGTIASADSLDSPLTQSFLNLHHVESLKTKVIVKNILLPD